MKKLITKKVVCLVFLTLSLIITLSGCSQLDYKKGLRALDEQMYDEAIEVFSNIQDYKDAAQLLLQAKYGKALNCFDNGQYEEAIEIFAELGNYNDATSMLNEAQFKQADVLLGNHEYAKALQLYQEIGTNSESLEKLYNLLAEKMNECNYEFVSDIYELVKDYKDVQTNVLFSGAKLIASSPISIMDTEIGRSFTYATYSQISLSFEKEKLKEHILGGTIYIFSKNMTTDVDIEKEWDYRFDGNNIYIANDGQYEKAGQINGFDVDTKGRPVVNITLKLNGGMDITRTDFEL